MAKGRAFDRPHGTVLAAFSTLCDVLGRSGGDFIDLVNGKPGFAGGVVADILKRVRPVQVDVARKIMGNDIIFPEEIDDSCMTDYSPKLIEQIIDSLPSPEVLNWCRTHNFVVCAGPPVPLSMVEIARTSPEELIREEAAWYLNKDGVFRNRVLNAGGWLLIHKEPEPDSLGKSWSDWTGSQFVRQYIPEAHELYWLMAAYYIVRGIRLFGNHLAMSRSKMSDETHSGKIVCVGGFDLNGIQVQVFDRDRRHQFIGLALAHDGKG